MATCKLCDICGKAYPGILISRGFSNPEIRSSRIELCNEENRHSIFGGFVGLDACPTCFRRVTDFIGFLATQSKIGGDGG